MSNEMKDWFAENEKERFKDYKCITPHIEFVDVSDEMNAEFEEEYDLVWLQCLHRGNYIGYIAWDWGQEYYLFYPDTDMQLLMNEQMMMDLYEVLTILNANRRMN